MQSHWKEVSTQQAISNSRWSLDLIQIAFECTSVCAFMIFMMTLEVSGIASEELTALNSQLVRTLGRTGETINFLVMHPRSQA